jgi:hypothetical protein
VTAWKCDTAASHRPAGLVCAHLKHHIALFEVSGCQCSAWWADCVTSTQCMASSSPYSGAIYSRRPADKWAVPYNILYMA